MARRRPWPSTPRRTSARVLMIALLLQGNWGCGALRHPDPPALAELAVQAEIKRDRRGRLEGDLTAYSTLRGVLVGTATGVPAGGLTGGTIGLGAGILTCGATIVLAPLCLLITTAAGAVVGGVVGLVGGGVMGFVGGLPAETARAVTAVLSRVEEGRSLEDDFRIAVQQAVPAEKQADASEAVLRLNARLESFDLRQHSKDRLSVRLLASMVQTWQDEDGRQRRNRCRYRYDSQRKPAQTWLERDGAVFGEVITQGLETFARWMNRDLEDFASRTERRKSDEAPRSCFRERRWYRFY